MNNGLRLHKRSYCELYDRIKVKKLFKGLSSGCIKLSRYINKNKNKKEAELINELVERLMKLQRKKKHWVHYEFCIPDYGRVFVKHGQVSLGSLPREIRGTLAADNYIDIDINNCHPVLAVQLCDKYGIKCDALRDYVDHRDDYLTKCMQEFECDRDAAKTLFLRIMYGGSYDCWAKDHNITKDCPEWIDQFNVCVEGIYNSLLSHFTEEIKYLNDHGKPEHEYNRVGATISWILQNKECEILNCMLNYIANYGKGIGNCILCYDGFMMLKNKFTPDLLANIEEYVYNQLNFKIKLSAKPFTTIDLDNIVLDDSDNLYNDSPAPETKYYDQDVMIDSLNRDYEFGKEYFERYHAFDKTTNKFIYANLLKNIVEFIGKEDMKTRYGNLFFNKEDSDKPAQFIQYWIIDPKRRDVLSVDEIPYSGVFTEDRIFYDNKCMNTFTGFDKRIANEITDEQRTDGDKWFTEKYMDTLIRLCEGNQDYAQWLLCFFAQIVQHPEDRKDRAVIIVGEQGNGKNTILEALKQVIGEDHYSTQSDPTKYFSEHAIEHAHKLLCNFDESSCKNADKFAEQLKTFVTTQTVEINEKFVKQYKLRNYARMIATSNKTTALPVDFRSGDRRFVMFAARDFMVDGVAYEANTPEHSAYFNEFYRVMNSNWFPRYFYDKLMSVDLSVWDYNEKFDTELKNDMIYNCKNSVELFLDDYDLSDIIEKSADVSAARLNNLGLTCDGFATRIDANDLFDAYQLYCETDGYDVVTKRMFNRCIKENRKFKRFFLKYLKSNSKYYYIVNRSAYRDCYGYEDADVECEL